MQRVRHDGRETAYRYAGERSDPAVLYVHGSGASHQVWSGQYGARGPRRPAAALDLSGHGESDDVDVSAGAATLSTYVEDVAAVARATDADVVVGNSLGGAVALQAVLQSAVSPRALVLLGTGAKLTVHEDLRAALRDDFDGAVDFLHGPDRLFHDPDPERLDRSRAMLLAVGQATTRRDFETCHRFDVRDRLDEISQPVLAMCGEHDELTPPAFHEYLADEIPNGTVETVPGAAHLAMVERPAASTDLLTQFLGKLDRQ